MSQKHNIADAIRKRNPNRFLLKVPKSNLQMESYKWAVMLQQSLYRHSKLIPESTVPMPEDLIPAHLYFLNISVLWFLVMLCYHFHHQNTGFLPFCTTAQLR